MPSAHISVPAELLHEFVAWLVASYIDDLVAGPLALPSVPMPEMWEPYPDDEGWDKLIEETLEKDAMHTAPNPVLPLFSASYGTREITLHVLSVALGIPLLAGEADQLSRLETKPWTVLQSIRLCFSNPHIIPPNAREQALEYATRSPLLDAYATIGQMRAMDRVLRYRQQQLFYQRRGDWQPRVKALLREFADLQKATGMMVTSARQIEEVAFAQFVAARADIDVSRNSALLVYGVSITMAKFVQDIMDALDRQRASVGIPSVHETDKLLLFILEDMRRLEQAALNLQPHIQKKDLIKKLDHTERTFAYDILNSICHYEPHPSNAAEYKKCQVIACAYRDKVAPYL